MIDQPQKRISERALTIWRILGAIYSFFTLLLGVGLVVLTILFDWPAWLIAIAIAAVFLHAAVFIVFMPALRWKRWRYEVREQEIELQHGVFFIKRTLVPMVRVQHVDTVQGPLLRKYGLATVTISTAATIHQIPALDLQEAEGLRYSISRLARVEDEDV